MRENISYCQRCGVKIVNVSEYKRKYCVDCYPIQHKEVRSTLAKITKKELRERCKSYSTFKSTVTCDAARVYKAHNKPMICQKCGYSLHVEICHIKDVADFSDDALIEEINHPTNLIALCRNHHWEFDHGHIVL